MEEESQEDILDALPVAEWEENTSAGYAVERDDSDEPLDSDERDRPPPRRPRAPKRRRRRRRITIDDSGDSEWWSLKEGWYGNVHGGVLGGVLMLGIALVLFIVGLAINRIFYLTIILGVIGIAAIIAGLIHKR